LNEEDEDLVYKQATTTKERTSIGSTNAKKNSGLEPMTTEEVQLSLVLLATTKESVAGTTTSKERRIRRLDRRCRLELGARR